MEGRYLEKKELGETGMETLRAIITQPCKFHNK